MRNTLDGQRIIGIATPNDIHITCYDGTNRTIKQRESIFLKVNFSSMNLGPIDPYVYVVFTIILSRLGHGGSLAYAQVKHIDEC